MSRYLVILRQSTDWGILVEDADNPERARQIALRDWSGVISLQNIELRSVTETGAIVPIDEIATNWKASEED